MQVEDILDDMPTTPHERAELIEHLLEMIERLNQSIQRHEAYQNPDRLAIKQYAELRTKYVGQLDVLLNQFGLVVQMPDNPQPNV
ncbi:hypothetical protein [Spirosoma montaniterrae]|uniref:Uncharacterized protein n=1 Tax=Spirosoma montaniterrae TaxID=1178516 RepID=A0A1P9X3E3_9BACT|nr:hypothetical protein [Spirosoma montaniterrae]AQG82131.1 hypothetical protein AWR27_24240 [Spirosoma montaniterrae]